ncbi:hypothetical protein AVEN_227097-1 [Araneus ventricosus]|uniref:DUF7041 domain-containing protein n=1 Tax=Araneus ventricosus TaxID=182803 RepID=A0A4Y2BV83_ARAVE|nr:hypothetical protein AVEN_227097-1 [Araneus ventricosus]
MEEGTRLRLGDLSSLRTNHREVIKQPLPWPLKLTGISAEKTKFHTVVAALDSKVLSCIADIVQNPPSDAMYDALKTRILRRFSQSESTKLRVLLQDLQLGDGKPSLLLQEMRNLAAGNIVDDVLKSIWMQRLPTSIQQILSVSKDTLDGLAQISDKVNEVSSFRREVNAVLSENSELQSLGEVTNLSAELKRITHSRFRRAQSSKRESSNNRARRSSHTRTDNLNLLCWYRRRFAEKATKCVKPCSFQEN